MSTGAKDDDESQALSISRCAEHCSKHFAWINAFNPHSPGSGCYDALHLIEEGTEGVKLFVYLALNGRGRI